MRILLAVAPLLFSSCVFRTHQVGLHYPPCAASKTQLTETSFERPVRIALSRFEDLRRDPNLIGEQRNAWMMHTGQVRSVGSVAGWLQDALAFELEGANFAITALEETGTPPLVLQGEVELVGSSRHSATTAVVEFSVKLKRGFKILWAHRYRGVASLSAETQDQLREQFRREIDPWGEALARALCLATAPLARDVHGALADEAGRVRE